MFIFAAWTCVACGKTQASPQTKDDVKYEVGIYEIVPFSEANFPAFPQYDDYQKAKEIEEVLPYRDFYVYSDTAVVNTIIALNNIEEMGYKHVWLPKNSAMQTLAYAVSGVHHVGKVAVFFVVLGNPLVE